MTVLKATLRTNDELGAVEINLVWHKQLPGTFNGPPGYTVELTDKVATTLEGKYHESRRDIALRHAVRLFKRYEKESNQRAIAQSKTP